MNISGEDAVTMILGLGIPGLLSSIVVGATGAYFWKSTNAYCAAFPYWLFLVIGVIFCVILLVSLVVTYKGLFLHRSLICYLWIALLFSVTLITILSITNKSINSYKVKSDGKKLEICLQNNIVCSKVEKNMGAIVMSCCEKPPACILTNISIIRDADCIFYDDIANIRCFRCNSCKNAISGRLKAKWKDMEIILIICIIVISVLYIAQVFVYWRSRERIKNHYLELERVMELELEDLR